MSRKSNSTYMRQGSFMKMASANGGRSVGLNWSLLVLSG